MFWCRKIGLPKIKKTLEKSASHFHGSEGVFSLPTTCLINRVLNRWLQGKFHTEQGNWAPCSLRLKPGSSKANVLPKSKWSTWKLGNFLILSFYLLPTEGSLRAIQGVSLFQHIHFSHPGPCQKEPVCSDHLLGPKQLFCVCLLRSFIFLTVICIFQKLCFLHFFVCMGVGREKLDSLLKRGGLGAGRERLRSREFSRSKS